MQFMCSACSISVSNHYTSCYVWQVLYFLSHQVSIKCRLMNSTDAINQELCAASGQADEWRQVGTELWFSIRLINAACYDTLAEK